MSPLPLSILQLAGGIVLLIVGGTGLVRSSVALAERLGVSTFVIGVTIVAWGTSAPETALNVIASIEDKGALAFGNLVGASIANLTLILGIAALVRPLPVAADIRRRALPFMLTLLLVVTAVIAWPALRGRATVGMDRPGAAVLLGAFVFYAVLTVWGALRPGARDIRGRKGEEDVRRSRMPIWLAILILVVSIALLVLGGALAVDGASGLARWLGLGEQVIGLTIVALGTTSPELVATLMAIRQRQGDLALGNAIGSTLFNMGFILALATLIHPADLPLTVLYSLGALCAAAIVLSVFSRTAEAKVTRVEGGLLAGIYVAWAAIIAARAAMTATGPGG